MTTLNLTKGSTLNLAKAVTDSKIQFELGWTGVNGKTLDLDSYIAVLDKDNVVLDFIYFGHKKTSGIKHHGDDLTGGGRNGGVNETISIKTSELNPRATTLIAGLFIYSGASSLEAVDYAFTQVKDNNGNIVVKYDIRNEFKGFKSVEVASLNYKEGAWSFNALGNGSSNGYSGTLSKYSVGKTVGSGGGGIISSIFGGLFR